MGSHISQQLSSGLSHFSVLFSANGVLVSDAPFIVPFLDLSPNAVLCVYSLIFRAGNPSPNGFADSIDILLQTTII